ncbi:hypothetical protein FJT64_025211 [Amphibalanus amphitrite]|uniref:CCHC-type domain-containing protein n=1 Tax=Amphibalanus amphitrite TaxID=1232801 RepID=A0A6A4W5U5_AMPAM|nr:hypothetical protein FJT64_025211 [Amphibalanus amphitrite]
MGLRSAETVKRLCAVQNLSLSHAIAVCRADEAAARDAVELRAGGLARAAAHQVDAAERHRAPPSAGPRRRDGGWCAACGRRRHRMGDACPARGQRCRSCRQLDHFAAVCPDASGDYDDRRPATSYQRRRLTPSRPRSSPPGRRYRPDPYRSSSRSPSPSLDTRRSQRRQPWRGTRVRFQSSEGSSDRSPDGAARRPAASAIIAVASVQSAPRVRLDVTAQRRASVLALPDTGADICVGGLDFLKEMDEYPENLLPPEQHPRTANGETVKSLGVLPVSLNLGRVSVQESVHILEGVSGLLLSWKAVKGLHIIPAGYPQQITADLPEPASGSRTRDAPDRPRPGPARHRHRSRAALPDGGTSSDCVAAVSRDGAAGEATAATPVERPDSSLPTAMNKEIFNALLEAKKRKKIYTVYSRRGAVFCKLDSESRGQKMVSMDQVTSLLGGAARPDGRRPAAAGGADVDRSGAAAAADVRAVRDANDDGGGGARGGALDARLAPAAWRSGRADGGSGRSAAEPGSGGAAADGRR